MVKQDYWRQIGPDLWATLMPHTNSPNILNKVMQVLWFLLKHDCSFGRTFSSVMYFIIWGSVNFSRMLHIAVFKRQI